MKKVLIGIVMVMALASCNSTKNVVYMQDVQLDTVVDIAKVNELRVRPGDMLNITVTSKEPQLTSMFNPVSSSNQDGDLKNSIGGTSSSGSKVGATGSRYNIPYTIDSKGDIDFPVLGELHVAGLTREAIAKMIKKRIIEGGYVTDPKVNVSFANLKYTVLGEVGSPGTYYFSDDKKTILEALADAGDLTIYGKRDGIYLTRIVDGKRSTTKLDLRTADIYNSPVYYLQQDDVIYVEPNNVRTGQSSINENSFKSVSMWMSIASFLMSLSVFIFK